MSRHPSCSTYGGGWAGPRAWTATARVTCPGRSSSTWTVTWPRLPGPAGRHPLPDPAAFTDAMRAAGVSRDRPVVVYDDRDATAAARGWWLLRYYGHEHVRVLDGGYQAWLAAGLPVSTADPGREAGRLHRAARATCRCWTRRAPNRWRRPGCCSTRGRGSGTGESRSPVDPVAGHIPGAVSAPTAGQREPGRHLPGRCRTRRPLRRPRQPPGRPVGAYCGSGVTAAQEVLALALAGIPAALYVGSWSDWITDPARPVATGG